MFTPLHRLPLLPSIEHNGDGVILSMAIRGQISQQRFARRLHVAGECSETAQHIVSVNKKVCRHKSHAIADRNILSMQRAVFDQPMESLDKTQNI
jgi:hypothetical protein